MEAEAPKSPSDLLNSVFQLGIVVADLDAVMDEMRRIFNLEPVIVMECDYPQVNYRGTEIDAKSRIAKYDHFGVLLEFVQPSGDDSMWSDALKASPNDAVLHHIRFNDVPSNDVVTELMAERGVERLQQGTSVVHPDCKFTYYDTERTLGFVTEIVTDISH